MATEQDFSHLWPENQKKPDFSHLFPATPPKNAPGTPGVAMAPAPAPEPVPLDVPTDKNLEFLKKSAEWSKPPDPTQGNSFFDNFNAALAMGAGDTWDRIRQMAAAAGAGNAPEVQRDIDEKARLNAPLKHTWGGLLGNAVAQGGLSLVPGGVLNRIGALTAGTLPGISNAATTAGQFLNAPKGVIPNAAVGALQGFTMQPVVTGQSAWDNAKLGAIGGAAIPVAQSAANIIKLAAVDPMTESGKNVITARLANQFSDDPAKALAAARNPTSPVPGYEPMMHQLVNDTGLASLARSIGETNVLKSGPAQMNFDAAMKRRYADQNAALINAVREHAGTKSTLSALMDARDRNAAPLSSQLARSTAEVQTQRTVNLIDRMLDGRWEGTAGDVIRDIRRKLVEPYPAAERGSDAWKRLNEFVSSPPRISDRDLDAVRTARTIMDRVRKGTIDAPDAVEALKQLNFTGKRAGDAIAEAKALMQAGDSRLVSDPDKLYGVIWKIQDKIQEKGVTKLSNKQIRPLLTIRKSLDNAIASAEPAYQQLRSGWKADSKPINQQEILQYLLDQSIKKGADMPHGTTPALNISKFADELKDPRELVAAATEFKRARSLDPYLTPEAKATLKAVEQQGLLSAQGEAAGASTNSATARYLTSRDALSQTAQNLGLPRWSLDNPWGQALAGRPLSKWIYSGTEEDVKAKLGNALLNPKEYAFYQDMLKNREQGLLSNQPHPLKSLANRALAGGLLNFQQQ